MKLYFSILFVCVICSSGAFRHDTNQELYLELAKKSEFNSCVRLVNFNDTSTIGSAVFVSENWILTAAHNVIKFDVKKDTLIKGKSVIVYYTPYNFRIVRTQDIRAEVNGQLIEVDSFVVHPKYSDSTGHYDMCLMKVKTKCININFPTINSSFNELGDTAIVVGFGLFLPASSKSSEVHYTTKHAGYNVIDKIGGETIGQNAMMMYADMDHPTNGKKCNRMGSKVPLALEYIPTAGDSGSPLFTLENNKLVLIGICSGGGVNYKDFMKYGFYSQIGEWTRVSLFNEWLTQTIKG